MTPKQTALIQVAKIMLSGMFFGGLTVLLLNTFSLLQIGVVLALVLLAFFTKFVYDIELSKAESLEKLNKNR